MQSCQTGPLMEFLNRIFKKKAKALSVKDMTFDTGFSDRIDEIFYLAQTDISYNVKIPLLEGCMQAFGEGRPQPMRAFLKGYLEFKRHKGSLTDILSTKMDDGISNLVARPAMLLVEKSHTPKETLETLGAELSAFFRSALHDLVLRESVLHGSWPAAEAALDLGADPNAAKGRPLINALSKGDHRLMELLFLRGARIDRIPQDQLSYDNRGKLTAFYARLTGQETTPETVPEPPPLAPKPSSPKNPSGFRL